MRIDGHDLIFDYSWVSVLTRVCLVDCSFDVTERSQIVCLYQPNIFHKENLYFLLFFLSDIYPSTHLINRNIKINR